jgi:hypothetical protein
MFWHVEVIVKNFLGANHRRAHCGEGRWREGSVFAFRWIGLWSFFLIYSSGAVEEEVFPSSSRGVDCKIKMSILSSSSAFCYWKIS